MWLLFASFVGVEPDRPVDDEEVQRLVRSARVGNALAARRLYALHVRRLFRAVRPLCASEAEAEDVVQEAFLKALGALTRYEPREGSRFIAWLTTIGLNTASKHARGRRRSVELSPERLEVLRGAEGEDPEKRALRDALLSALAELPERERRILSLRYGAELTSAEVARLAGVSEANVRKICERQRRRLLERLTEGPRQEAR